MDGAQVAFVVCSTFGQRDDVVDLVGEHLAADVADPAVLAHDFLRSSCLLGAGEAGAACCTSGLVGCPSVCWWMGGAWS